jgi:Na+-driven multidrug efflux pump
VTRALASTGGDDAGAAFGIVNRVLLFAVMPVFGVVQGLLPVVGFNYGAKQYCRVVSALRISIGASTVLCTAGAALFLTVPEAITGLFTTSAAVTALGADAALLLALGMPRTGFQIMASGLFQAIGKTRPSFVLSLLRQVILLVPLVTVLAPVFGTAGVWAAFPAADLSAALLTFLLYRNEMRRLRNSCGSGAEDSPAGTAGS